MAAALINYKLTVLLILELSKFYMKTDSQNFTNYNYKTWSIILGIWIVFTF